MFLCGFKQLEEGGMIIRVAFRFTPTGTSCLVSNCASEDLNMAHSNVFLPTVVAPKQDI